MQSFSPWSERTGEVNQNSNSPLENSNPPLALHRSGTSQFLSGTPGIGGELEQLLKEAPNEKMLKNARMMMAFGFLGGMLFGVPFIFVPIGFIMEMSYWSKETMFRIKTGQTTKKEVSRKAMINIIFLILGLCIGLLIVWRMIISLDVGGDMADIFGGSPDGIDLEP